MKKLLLIQSILLCIAIFFSAPACGKETLFGYNEKQQKTLDSLPHWLDVLERQVHDDMLLQSKTQKEEHSLLTEWYRFLQGVKTLNSREQILQVNSFANKNKYILDSINYGMEDYWAVIREFLLLSGDCEDYAITKYFSLRWLGFSEKELRLVVLQDTNLRTGHAVLAVYLDDEILLLDNQIKQVVSHKKVVHYVPLYSTNAENWWIHFPPM